MAVMGIRGVVGSVARRAARANARRAARDARARRDDDAVDLLTEDHARIVAFLARFDDLVSSGRQKATLVERVCDEIELHARVEEEIFYPTVRALITADELMDEAAVEHEVAHSLVLQLRSLRPGDFRYDAKVRVLSAYVRHHFECEEENMFPRVRETGIDLTALARALKARKRQLKGSATTALASTRSGVSMHDA